MNCKRTEFGKNIGFTSFVDEKFNTCSLCIYMITELDKNSVSEYAVANSITATVNSKLKTIAEMNERLSELYGAYFNSSTNKRGDLQYLSVSASWLHDKFAIDKEPVTEQMLEIMTDCIFSPYAENGKFNEDIFRLCQKNILDSIEAELNEKRDYTIEQASRLAFKGEPAENHSCGTRESVMAVTPQSAFEAYQKLLETAQIEIMFVSPKANENVPELFRKKFEGISRNSRSYGFYAPSPIKPESQLVTEELDVRQAKIAMCFKSSTDDYAALRIMCMIFGGTPVSKLFMNVREKLSLCYYCACRMNEYKGLLMVDCGVEKNNIEKATNEILHQLDEIKNGNITETEIQSALLALENAYTTIGDTPGSYISWYFDCFCRGKNMTPEEYLENLFAVTKERIIKAAKSVVLDSAYHMLNKEDE